MWCYINNIQPKFATDRHYGLFDTAIQYQMLEISVQNCCLELQKIWGILSNFLFLITVDVMTWREAQNFPLW